ncbi:MAG TPA: hypothetical protein VGJ84_19945 [Polyangiaceae bacterium]
MLLAVLLLFGALVSGRIHGSSIALGASIWAGGESENYFLASPLLKRMSPQTAARWRDWLMATPRYTRADEWAHETMLAMAQFQHTPRFPVINTHIGNGQNMLVVKWVPVLHFSAIARPLTWGYLLFGREYGLAWSWWFQVFSGFVALFLLFEILLPGRPLLSVLGAGWFCSSAYVACWSVWPSHVVSFGAFAVVCAYYLAVSQKRWVLLSCGAGLGLSVAGFLMQLYPPWQVPLGYVFLFLFVGLVVRDRLLGTVREEPRLRAAGLGIAILTFALVFGSFVHSTADALRALVNTEYPGKRRMFGGDCPSWRLFGSLYNFFTNAKPPRGSNPSEAAGFFLFYPGAVVALTVSRKIRARFDCVGWLLIALGAFFIGFGHFGVPRWIANGTLMSLSQGFRAQIATGLISIIVSVQLLACARIDRWRERSSLTRGAIVLVACAVFYTWQGAQFQAAYGTFPTTDKVPFTVVAISLGAGVLCALLALGRAREFALLLAPSLGITSASFNPLSVGFPSPAKSQLHDAVESVLKRDPHPNGRPSLWLTYGGPAYPNPGIVASVMGARVLSGVYQYPELDLWRPLDPEDKERFKYNRYALVSLQPAPLRDRRIAFIQRNPLLLTVRVSPVHPSLRNLGARYVLTFGRSGIITDPPFKLLHRQSEGQFAIWELPDKPLL